VIPTEPEPVISEPFEVLIENMAPLPRPFRRTSDPLVFDVLDPVYDDSQVLWNGQSLALSPPDKIDTRQVRIPAQLAPLGTGELVLVNPPPGGGVQRTRVEIGESTSRVIPDTYPPPLSIGADISAIDRSRRLLYTINDWVAGVWTISCFRLPETDPVWTASFPMDGAVAVTDFDLTSDGRSLYVFDNLLRVWRVRTDSRTAEFRFQIQTDAFMYKYAQYESRHWLRVLGDAPDSVLVATPSRHVTVYDGDQPRPYSDWDFPGTLGSPISPVLAGRDYLYATHPYDSLSGCLVRYPLDAWGFGPPDEFCNFAARWGAYPEMKVFGSELVLQNDESAIGISLDGTVSTARFFPGQNLSVTVEAAYHDRDNNATWILRFRNMDTGERVGHYPRNDYLLNKPSKILLLDEDLLVFMETSHAIKIVPDWKSLAAWYP
jgi:hypothetical protein